MPTRKSAPARRKNPKARSRTKSATTSKKKAALRKPEKKAVGATRKKKKTTTAANPFVAQFFPLPLGSVSLHEQSLGARSSGGNFVGVCFSGGGSRALTAAMGQLRGLKYLGLLDDVLFISSVSGGTWATSIFTYLPKEYDDDDFLGLPVPNPYNLTMLNWNSKHPEYALDYLSRHNLGNVPPSLGVFNDLSEILALRDKYNYPSHDLWQGLVGHFILRPWNLWNAGKDGFPTQYYSYSSGYLRAKGGILARNKQLSLSRFFCVQRQRPLYVMNGSMVSNPKVEGSQLLPFESTAVGIGVRNYFPGIGPNGEDIGGGLLEPFAMGSTYLKDISPNTASVTVPRRPFSLSDMVSISSAAPAEMIQKSFPRLKSLIPKYRYWPVEGRATNPVYDYEFADGGSLEDTGITALLNRNLPNIIAFVNGMTPLTQDNSGTIVVDPQIQLLFGKQPSAASLQYNELYRDPVPNNDLTFCQVFPTANYDELAQGLWAANSGNYNGTAIYLQTLPVLPNANFGIQGNYNVRVLWVTNTWVEAWYDLLSDEVGAFAFEQNGLYNFPNYNTFTHLEMSPSQVNLLAQLSFWNVTSETAGPQGSNAALMQKMFYG